MIAIIFLLFFWSCQTNQTSDPVTTLFYGNAMTIDYRIIVGKALSPIEKEKIDSIVQMTFKEIDTIFNKWNPESELSRLNHLKGGVSVPLSVPLYRFLVTVGKIVALTEGRFDPTIGALQTLWQRKLESGQLPSKEEISSASKGSGWHKIHYEGGIFFKDVDSLALDLGGIVKGYCVDLLTERLKLIGYADLFVDWGGEIRTSGKHPKGRPWALFIRGLDDLDSGRAIAYLNVCDRAIATSGDYLQNWTISGPDGPVTYFHIIDPTLRRPLMVTDDSIATASVMVDNCTFADGLATALMMFSSSQEAVQWIEKIKTKISPLDYWVMSRREWRENVLQAEMEE